MRFKVPQFIDIEYFIFNIYKLWYFKSHTFSLYGSILVAGDGAGDSEPAGEGEVGLTKDKSVSCFGILNELASFWVATLITEVLGAGLVPKTSMPVVFNISSELGPEGANGFTGAIISGAASFASVSSSADKVSNSLNLSLTGPKIKSLISWINSFSSIPGKIRESLKLADNSPAGNKPTKTK